MVIPVARTKIGNGSEGADQKSPCGDCDFKLRFKNEKEPDSYKVKGEHLGLTDE